MKNTFTIALLLISSIIYAQDCDPFTASHDLIHGKLKQTVLRGEDGNFNPLYIKTGIGPDGDMDTRTYAPLVYSSNIWAGGLTPSGNFKLAAGKSNQLDWWPGPLDFNGLTNTDQCSKWNQVWTVTIEDILEAREIFLTGGPCDQMPESILNWPGRNNSNLSFLTTDQGYADFWDTGGNGNYNPCDGDFPLVGIRGCESFNFDEMIRYIPSEFSFYLMNDNGAAHNISFATSIQMEVHVYTFTFKSQVAEGVVFFKHKFINKASEDIREMKFGQWLDFDLGCSENDKLASDESQQMIYAYNGSNEEDCGENSLAEQKASVGFSYLKGPRGPFIIVEGSEGQDSLVHPPIGSGDFDTLAELRASNAMIPSNCFDTSSPPNCNPQTTTDFYNLLNTRNFDGTPALDNNGMPSPFMYTGNPADASEWSLCTDQNIAETTGIMSIGNILLQPQATNEIISAIYYTDDINTDCPDDAAIKYKDGLVQSLFDNCLYQHMAPPSPEISVLYSDTGVDIDISNIPFNYREPVLQANPSIHEDRHYNFEGIKIYQVASKNFDMTELTNPKLSALVYQGDINNDITDITNFRSDFIDADQTWPEDIKVTGANNGLVTELFLTYDFIRDQPIEQSDELYYVAISYAYNNYEDFDPMGIIDNNGNTFATGQQYQYIESNCGLKTVASVISVSGVSSPYDAGRYEYIYNNNTINIFNIEEDLYLQLLSIDGKSLEQWNAKKGDRFTSHNLSKQLTSGMYILNATTTHSGLNGSHKLVVTR